MVEFLGFQSYFREGLDRDVFIGNTRNGRRSSWGDTQGPDLLFGTPCGPGGRSTRFPEFFLRKEVQSRDSVS